MFFINFFDVFFDCTFYSFCIIIVIRKLSNLSTSIHSLFKLLLSHRFYFFLCCHKCFLFFFLLLSFQPFLYNHGPYLASHLIFHYIPRILYPTSFIFLIAIFRKFLSSIFVDSSPFIILKNNQVWFIVYQLIFV